MKNVSEQAQDQKYSIASITKGIECFGHLENPHQHMVHQAVDAAYEVLQQQRQVKIERILVQRRHSPIATNVRQYRTRRSRHNTDSVLYVGSGLSTNNSVAQDLVGVGEFVTAYAAVG